MFILLVRKILCHNYFHIIAMCNRKEGGFFQGTETKCNDGQGNGSIAKVNCFK